jgi:3-oxoacyl-[acyl-carrier protein] reductase
MLLKSKTAILYGAAGHIGRAVSHAFAREGAQLFLTGRDAVALKSLASELASVGGKAEVAEVDALDATAVERHLADVIKQAGGIDISFNMISYKDVQGKELCAMSIEDYLRPIDIATRTQFITATAAARHMTARGRGVIMAITATPSRLALPLVGGFGTACGAIEGMMRTLAAEVGPKGVRVCWLRSAGSPESFGAHAATDVGGAPAGLSDDGYLDNIRKSTLLKRFPKLAEVGEVAALVASDRAAAMTGAAMNITCGQIVD